MTRRHTFIGFNLDDLDQRVKIALIRHFHIAKNETDVIILDFAPIRAICEETMDGMPSGDDEEIMLDTFNYIQGVVWDLKSPDGKPAMSYMPGEVSIHWEQGYDDMDICVIDGIYTPPADDPAFKDGKKPQIIQDLESDDDAVRVKVRPVLNKMLNQLSIQEFETALVKAIYDEDYYQELLKQ